MQQEVLGINARNLDFVYPLNPRRAFPQVDDKLRTKEILAASGVPVPRTLAVIENFLALRDLDRMIPSDDGFAVKPAQGSGGRGILVVDREEDGSLVTSGRSGRRILEMDELRTHVCHILAGVHSLDKIGDRAFLEELLVSEPVLGGLSLGGLPDIRVLVLGRQPVMAMTRIPTRRSRGKANLHQGGLGLGIDINTGRTIAAIEGNRPILRHPDTGADLVGIEVPSWPGIMDLASRSVSCVGLGYVGADIVIDRDRGPLVMELNARPGLNIQLANSRGLAPSLYGGADNG